MTPEGKTACEIITPSTSFLTAKDCVFARNDAFIMYEAQPSIIIDKSKTQCEAVVVSLNELQTFDDVSNAKQIGDELLQLAYEYRSLINNPDANNARLSDDDFSTGNVTYSMTAISLKSTGALTIQIQPGLPAHLRLHHLDAPVRQHLLAGRAHRSRGLFQRGGVGVDGVGLPAAIPRPGRRYRLPRRAARGLSSRLGHRAARVPLHGGEEYQGHYRD